MTKSERINNEINRLKNAISKTKSQYLKRDYNKAIKRLQRQAKH